MFIVAKEKFGSRFAGVIDVVGIAVPKEIPSIDDDVLGLQFDLVRRYAILAMQIAQPLLEENGGDTIAVVRSLAGLHSTKLTAMYRVAKAALHQLVKYASDESVLATCGRGRESGKSVPGPFFCRRRDARRYPYWRSLDFHCF